MPTRELVSRDLRRLALGGSDIDYVLRAPPRPPRRGPQGRRDRAHRERAAHDAARAHRGATCARASAGCCARSREWGARRVPRGLVGATARRCPTSAARSCCASRAAARARVELARRRAARARCASGPTRPCGARSSPGTSARRWRTWPSARSRSRAPRGLADAARVPLLGARALGQLQLAPRGAPRVAPGEGAARSSSTTWSATSSRTCGT